MTEIRLVRYVRFLIIICNKTLRKCERSYGCVLNTTNNNTIVCLFETKSIINLLTKLRLQGRSRYSTTAGRRGHGRHAKTRLEMCVHVRTNVLSAVPQHFS